MSESITKVREQQAAMLAWQQAIEDLDKQNGSGPHFGNPNKNLITGGVDCDLGVLAFVIYPGNNGSVVYNPALFPIGQ